MSHILSPRVIADRQLELYNARDLEAYCALFATDAELVDLPSGKVLAHGLKEVRAVYADRFANPRLFCRVHAKMELGDFAIDRETVYGLKDGPLDVVALYEVIAGKIRRVLFVRETLKLPGV